MATKINSVREKEIPPCDTFFIKGRWYEKVGKILPGTLLAIVQQSLQKLWIPLQKGTKGSRSIPQQRQQTILTGWTSQIRYKRETTGKIGRDTQDQVAHKVHSSSSDHFLPPSNKSGNIKQLKGPSRKLLVFFWNDASYNPARKISKVLVQNL